MEKGFSVGCMNMTKDREIYSSVQTRAKETGAKQKRSSEKECKTLYMGGLNQQDEVSRKFALAQKTALKKLLDQFEADLEIDTDMAERADHVEELRASAREEIQAIRGLDDERRELQEQYEIDPDSQEQLQEQMRVLDKEEEVHRSALEEQRKEIIIENATIEATKKALLKVAPMLEVKEEAEAIMEEAVKSQISSLFEEGVDQIEENTIESQEKIAENQEKALEEKIEREKLKEKEAEKEELTQELQQTVFTAAMQNVNFGQQITQNMQSDIKSLIQEQTLLDVDLKGLRVNKQI